MNTRETFFKLESDESAIAFCKLVTTGKIQNPFSKAEWNSAIEYQATTNFPWLSPAQALSRYLDTPVGHALSQASKAPPTEAAKSAAKQAA
jgi:hypothetical protein